MDVVLAEDSDEKATKEAKATDAAAKNLNIFMFLFVNVIYNLRLA